MWDTFFPECGLSEERVERVKITPSEQAQEVGALYDIDEMITNSPGWMEQHDTMFPEQKLTEAEKMEILNVAVKMVQEELAEKSKQIYQIQVRQEETKSDSALVVSDWKVDSEIGLEACQS
jgi:hypothetical protein